MKGLVLAAAMLATGFQTFDEGPFSVERSQTSSGERFCRLRAAMKLRGKTDFALDLVAYDDGSGDSITYGLGDPKMSSTASVSILLGDTEVYTFQPQFRKETAHFTIVSYVFPSIGEERLVLKRLNSAAQVAESLKVRTDRSSESIPAKGLSDALLALARCRPKRA